MYCVIITEEGKIVKATNGNLALHQVVKKVCGSSAQIRHPVVDLPFSICLIAPNPSSHKKPNVMAQFLFPDIKATLKGDILLYKEEMIDNVNKLISLNDDELEILRQYFLKTLRELKDKIEKEKDNYDAFKEEKKK